jgi:hypothetical protein
MTISQSAVNEHCDSLLCMIVITHSAVHDHHNTLFSAFSLLLLYHVWSSWLILQCKIIMAHSAMINMVHCAVHDHNNSIYSEWSSWVTVQGMIIMTHSVVHSHHYYSTSTEHDLHVHDSYSRTARKFDILVLYNLKAWKLLHLRFLFVFKMKLRFHVEFSNIRRSAWVSVKSQHNKLGYVARFVNSAKTDQQLGWSRKWIFLLTRKSTFFRKYFYFRVIMRKYS